MTDDDFGLATAPLVDHHCHAVVAGALDLGAFDNLIGEAGPAAPGSTNFDTPTGLAIARLVRADARPGAARVG